MSITSNPPGLGTSPFFAYTGGAYGTVADSLRPGQAYWVKTNAPGTLYLGPSTSTSGSARMRIIPTNEAPPPSPEALANAPEQFSLEQNYPNPFNPTTELHYRLPVDARIHIRLFDVLGEEIRTLVDEVQPAGYRSVRWDGRNETGAEAPSGIYFYRLEATVGASFSLRVSPADPHETFAEVRKMVLIR